MTSLQAQPTMQRQEGELNVNVTVQQPPSKKVISGEKIESKEADIESNTSFKQILASLAETKKYLPQQVNTFLDSMEGKTIDDLRFEAMHLANKAQEEAKRKTSETLDNVKQRAQSITDMAQDVADTAKTRTNDIKQKGVDLVNVPIQATQNTTKNLANAVNEKTTGLMSNAWDYTRNTLFPIALPYAQKAQTMVVPYAEKLKPYAIKAKVLLPQPAKEFVEKNVEGKSPEELAKQSVVLARTKLLNAEEKAATEIPSLGQLVGEVKNATFSGKIVYNVLGLSEDAANAFFGKTEVSPDAGLLRRAWNLNTKVNKGMSDLTWQQLAMAGNMAKDMAYGRIDQTKQGVMSRAEMVKQKLSPVMTRIGQTPLVPGFVYKMLRADTSTLAPSMKMESSSKSSTPASAVTTTEKQKINVNVNVVEQPAAPAAKSDVTTSKSSETTKTTIGNTNAQGLGELGKPGMGITTTGGEEAAEHQESSVPPTEGSEASTKKKKHHSKA
jgi:hypothetical protein